jgi:hypothetical protein
MVLAPVMVALVAAEALQRYTPTTRTRPLLTTAVMVVVRRQPSPHERRLHWHKPWRTYLMMPYQSMALTMFFYVGWVGGKFKDQRACSHEHPILESPLRFEQRTYKETLARPYSGYFF